MIFVAKILPVAIERAGERVCNACAPKLPLDVINCPLRRDDCRAVTPLSGRPSSDTRTSRPRGDELFHGYDPLSARPVRRCAGDAFRAVVQWHETLPATQGGEFGSVSFWFSVCLKTARRRQTPQTR